MFGWIKNSTAVSCPLKSIYFENLKKNFGNFNLKAFGRNTEALTRLVKLKKILKKIPKGFVMIP